MTNSKTQRDNEILQLDGVELAIERRGPDGAPVALLIAGGGQSMDWWTPEFCDLLGAGELQVIKLGGARAGARLGRRNGGRRLSGRDRTALRHPLQFDEARVRALATLEVRRTHNMASSIGNHFIAESRIAVDPAEIRVPTLVLHSVDDPMFPFAHGEALARMIPGARLVRLEGVGHEIPPPAVWDVVMPELRGHLLHS